MSDEAALLAAIIAHPEEDTPRLMYADWLEEQGGEANIARAEFIRIQIERDRLYEVRDKEKKRYRALEKRAEQLAARHAKEWLKGFPGATHDEAAFLRGFLGKLELSARKCAKAPRPPWHREPILGIGLKGNAADVRRLCERGWLDGVLDLALVPTRPDDATALVEAVAESGCAPTLRRLSLWDEGYNDTALRAVAAGNFEQLCELSCMGQFTHKGWEAVLNSPAAALLEEVTAGHRAPWMTADQTRPGPELADVLAASKAASRLTFLWISGCGLRNKGVARLAAGGRRFTRLKTLHLDDERLGKPAFEALGAAKFPALTHLQMSCDLRDAAVKALIDSPLMARLEHLDLSLNDLTAATAQAIATCGRTRKLKYLDLGCNEIGDDGAAALAKSRNLPALKEMHLSTTRMTDAGADAVARAPWVGQLETLFMSYNAISKRKQAELQAKFGARLWISGSLGE